jgi:hypothetical protein
MFYIWHTLLVVAFIVMAFFMGLILGKKIDSKTRNLSLLNKKKDNKFNNLNKSYCIGTSNFKNNTYIIVYIRSLYRV